MSKANSQGLSFGAAADGFQQTVRGRGSIRYDEDARALRGLHQLLL
jgi:hypothetical protein